MQVDEGVDFIIGETFSWLGEALIAVERAKKTGLPAMVTICFENKDETAEGKNAADAAKTLFDAGADIVGMNCLRPPQHILGPMEQMRKAVSGYLACQPVAYRTPKEKPDFTSLPEFPYALDPLQLTRKEMADYAVQARDTGNQLHRRLLRHGCDAHSGNGASAEQAAGRFSHLEEGRREADVGIRILRSRQHEGWKPRVSLPSSSGTARAGPI